MRIPASSRPFWMRSNWAHPRPANHKGCAAGKKALLEGADADRLNDVGGWIADCASGDELLNRAGQASGLA